MARKRGPTKLKTVKRKRSPLIMGSAMRGAALLAAGTTIFAAGLGIGVFLGAEPGQRGEILKEPVTTELTNVPTSVAQTRTLSRTTQTRIYPRPEAPSSLDITPRTVSRPSLTPPVAKRDWEAHAISFNLTLDGPLIAIVLDDMGIDRGRSGLVSQLPGPLTLSYLSYAEDLVAQTAAARARGHELLLHLPMEPVGDADPGPGALLMHHDDSDLVERINFALARFPGFVGINNHMGSRFTADRDRMTVVFAALRKGGHLFLDSLTSPQTVAVDLGREMGVPVISRDVFLDDIDSEDEVWFRLLKAEHIAQMTGTAIAIGHPRDATIAVLEDWIAEQGDRTVRLAPLSAIARIRLYRNHHLMVHP